MSAQNPGMNLKNERPFETRSLDYLLPVVKSRAIFAIAKAEMDTGLKIIITCTFRNDAKQREYYEQGRTTPGRIITNDPGPRSAHSLRIAIDIAPAIKDASGLHLCYETDKWPVIAEAFKEQGFQWGGDWKSFRDRPHFQYLGGLTLDQIRNGEIPK